ncbi:uncharacterized protein K489DRAFT_64911 [Dissoconium aciculare CBS 342.82]|uniref:Uncharacterized protein n=1 Tax=Dissoconium aciculare CBS 342.82 TaxID=1314786 RepID=A0A6J3LXL0_9PEZI|nr:uncharacterized protein K489DRAFT_64911 [Dissoconium aciculare CBS 342.82]KAF1819372.1 hypothetical protein K489DRAFT_64911 [Dissoconium aciculare CBS 342.82]
MIVRGVRLWRCRGLVARNALVCYRCANEFTMIGDERRIVGSTHGQVTVGPTVISNLSMQARRLFLQANCESPSYIGGVIAGGHLRRRPPSTCPNMNLLLSHWTRRPREQPAKDVRQGRRKCDGGPEASISSSTFDRAIKRTVSNRRGENE